MPILKKSYILWNIISKILCVILKFPTFSGVKKRFKHKCSNVNEAAEKFASSKKNPICVFGMQTLSLPLHLLNYNAPFNLAVIWLEHNQNIPDHTEIPHLHIFNHTGTKVPPFVSFTVMLLFV